MADDITSSVRHITTLDFDLSLLKQQMNNIVADTASLPDRIRQSLGGQVQLDLFNNVKQDAVNTVGVIEQEFGKINKISFGEQIFDKIKWTAAFRATQILEEGMRNVWMTIKDVEFGIMEITRVLGDNTLNVQAFTQSVFDLAESYGRSFSDAQDIVLRFAQAGYSARDSIEMTKTSMLALNTAELSVESSTKSLIGIMKQWNLSAEEYQGVIDRINITADNFAITSQDLVDALLKSSSVAKNAGLSFNETVGALTALKVASGAAGREVGNAFRSILNFIQRPMSLKGFDDLGISVFANKITGELLPAMQILQNMAAKWNNSTEEMQISFMNAADSAGMFNQELANDIGALEEYNGYMESFALSTDTASTAEERLQATLAAGNFRRNYYISLMENMGMVTEVMTNLQDAEGYSMRENAKYMDTLTAKYEQFKTAIQNVAVAAGDSGLMGLAKGFVDLGTALAKASTNGIGLSGIIAGITVAISLLNKDFNIVKTIGNDFDLLKQKAAGAGMSVQAYTASTIGANLATAALNATITFGLSIAITGLITVINDMVKSEQRAIEASNELINSYKDFNREAQSNIVNLRGMESEFNRLSQGVNIYGENISLTVDEYERYKAMLSDILSISPSLITGINSEGQAISDKNNLIQESIRLMQEEQYYRLIQATSDDVIATKAKEIANEYKNAKQEIDNFRYSASENIGEMIAEKVSDIYAIGDEKLTQGISDMIERLNLNLSNLFMGSTEELIKFRDNADEIISTLGITGAQETILRKQLANFVDEYDSNLRRLDGIVKSYNPMLNLVAQSVEGYNELQPIQQDIVGLYTNTFDSITDITEDGGRKAADSVRNFVAQIENIELKPISDELMGLDKNKYEMYAEDYVNAYNGIIDRILGLLKESGIDEAVIGSIELPLRNSISNIETNITALKSDFAGVEQIINGINSLTLEELSLALMIPDETKQNIKTWEDFQKSVEEQRIVEALRDISGEIENVNSALDGLQSAYDTLTDVVEQYGEKNAISLETFQQLAELAPEYIRLLSDENGALTLNKTAIDNATQAYVEQLKVKMLLQQLNLLESIVDEATAQQYLNNALNEQLETKEAVVKAINRQMEILGDLAIQGKITAEQWTSINNAQKEAVQTILGLNVNIDKSTEALKNSKKATDDKKQSMVNLQSIYETLATATKEYSSAEGLQYDTLTKLMDLEPKYLALLVDENGQLNLNEAAFKNLALAEIDEWEQAKNRENIDLLNTLKREAAAMDDSTDATLRLAYAQTNMATSVLTAKFMLDAQAGSLDASIAETERAIRSVKAIADEMRSLVGSNGYVPKPAAKSSGSSGRTSTEKTWVEIEIANFEHLKKIGQTTLEQELELYKKISNSVKTTQDEKRNAIEKTYEIEQKLADKWLNDKKFQLSLLSGFGNAEQRIAIQKEIMDWAHKSADELRGVYRGLLWSDYEIENSPAIQEFKKIWLGAFEETQDEYDNMVDKMLTDFEKAENLGTRTLEQRLAFLEEILQKEGLSAEKRLEIEEMIADTRKDIQDDYINDLEYEIKMLEGVEDAEADIIMKYQEMRDYTQKILDDTINTLRNVEGWTDEMINGSSVIQELRLQIKGYGDDIEDYFDKIKDKQVSAIKDLIKASDDYWDNEIKKAKELQAIVTKDYDKQIKDIKAAQSASNDSYKQQIDNLKATAKAADDSYKSQIDGAKKSYDAQIKTIKGVKDQIKKARDEADYASKRGDILAQLDLVGMQTSREALEKEYDLRKSLRELDQKEAERLEDLSYDEQIKAIENKRDLEIEGIEAAREATKISNEAQIADLEKQRDAAKARYDIEIDGVQAAKEAAKDKHDADLKALEEYKEKAKTKYEDEIKAIEKLKFAEIDRLKEFSAYDDEVTKKFIENTRAKAKEVELMNNALSAAVQVAMNLALAMAGVKAPVINALSPAVSASTSALFNTSGGLKPATTMTTNNRTNIYPSSGLNINAPLFNVESQTVGSQVDAKFLTNQVTNNIMRNLLKLPK